MKLTLPIILKCFNKEGRGKVVSNIMETELKRLQM